MRRLFCLDDRGEAIMDNTMTAVRDPEARNSRYGQALLIRALLHIEEYRLCKKVSKKIDFIDFEKIRLRIKMILFINEAWWYLQTYRKQFGFKELTSEQAYIYQYVAKKCSLLPWAYFQITKYRLLAIEQGIQGNVKDGDLVYILALLLDEIEIYNSQKKVIRATDSKSTYFKLCDRHGLTTLSTNEIRDQTLAQIKALLNLYTSEKM